MCPDQKTLVAKIEGDYLSYQTNTGWTGSIPICLSVRKTVACLRDYFKGYKITVRKRRKETAK